MLKFHCCQCQPVRIVKSFLMLLSFDYVLYELKYCEMLV